MYIISLVNSSTNLLVCVLCSVYAIAYDLHVQCSIYNYIGIYFKTKYILHTVQVHGKKMTNLNIIFPMK